MKLTLESFNLYSFSKIKVISDSRKIQVHNFVQKLWKHPKILEGIFWLKLKLDNYNVNIVHIIPTKNAKFILTWPISTKLKVNFDLNFHWNRFVQKDWYCSSVISFSFAEKFFISEIFDYRILRFILVLNNLVAHIAKRLWNFQKIWKDILGYILEKNHSVALIVLILPM